MATPARRPRPGSAKPKREPAGSGLGGGLADSILKRQSEKRAAGRTSWVKVSDDEDEPTIIRAWDITPPKMDKDDNPVGGMFRIGYIHQVEFEVEGEDRKRKGKRKTFTIRRDRWCLDQNEEGEPCPGCKDELERRLKFWLPVIERDAPIVTEGGKITGYKDRVALLSGGSRLLTVLNRIQKKKGLINQDVEVTKSGEGFNVQYAGEALDHTSLSADDKQLIKDFDALKKLDRYTEIYDFEHFYDLPGEKDEDEDDDDPGEKSRRRGSAFGPRPGKASSKSRDTDDDDDDDDDAPPPRHRRSGSSRAGTRKPGGLSSLSKKNGSKPSSSTSSRRRRPPR